MNAFAEPHRMIPVTGGRLAYYRFGRGPDVVGIHGWPLHAATWRNVVPLLEKDVTLHLFDLPGAGSTEWQGRIGFEANAAAVREALDALGLGSYALLAHDSGGVVARLLAADDPRTRGLVLAGSEIPGHHSALLGAYLFVSRTPVLREAITAMLAVPTLRRSPFAFGACFEDPRYTDGDFARLFLEPLRRPEVRRGQMALLRAFRFDFIDGLERVHARIQAPALCIWGDRDPFFPIAKARQMLPQFAGGASLVAIPGAKLFPHEDRPAEFATHARDFLVRHAGHAAGAAYAANGA